MHSDAYIEMQSYIEGVSMSVSWGFFLSIRTCLDLLIGCKEKDLTYRSR
jgi:hypothetical protein